MKYQFKKRQCPKCGGHGMVRNITHNVVHECLICNGTGSYRVRVPVESEPVPPVALIEKESKEA